MASLSFAPTLLEVHPGISQIHQDTSDFSLLILLPGRNIFLSLSSVNWLVFSRLRLKPKLKTMQCSKSLLLSFLFVLVTMGVTAQLNLNTAATGNDLANAIVGSGVTITNVTLDCAPGGSAIFTDGNTTNIGLDDGILLTTGAANDAPGPNNIDNTSVDQPSAFHGDPDLASISPWVLQDACVLSFDFVPQSDVISVQYVFASEEYNEYVCSIFNDIFAFIVNGPIPGGGTYNNENVALIPGTVLPVAINTVNNGSPGANGTGNCISLDYSSLYVDNTSGATIEYDGFTVELTAEVEVIPGQNYTFKFAIADVSDGILDSGVFIKGESFSIFNCQAGNLSLEGGGNSPATFCSTDDTAINVNTSSLIDSDYTFFLTDDAGTVLEEDSNGQFDPGIYGVGSYFVYGVSSDGIVQLPGVGGNINDVSANAEEGCFEISEPFEIIIENCCSLQVECPDPTGVNVSCLSDIPDADPALVEIIDACGDVSITLASSITGSGCAGDPYIVTQSYLIEDDESSTTCEVTHTAADIEAPVILNPPVAEIELGCNEEVPEYTPEWTDNCEGELDLSAASSISIDGCVENIQRSWTATDACGNSTTINQSITRLIDTEDPVFEDYPYAITVQCDMDEIPAPGVNDDCSMVEITFEDILQSGGCYGTLLRTWIATDACGNSASAEQIISIDDNTAPTFIDLPEEEIFIGCSDDLPPVPDLTAEDNCDGEITVTFEETTLEDAEGNLCAGLTPEAFANGETCAGTTPASFVLFNFGGQESANFESVSIIWDEQEDGSIHITGDVVEIGNPNGGFTLNIVLENGLNWEEWSNQLFPTSYHDDCDISNGEHENWLYYLIAQGATANGWGVYDGVQLELSHAPSNLYFGAQIGDAANGKNTNYGSAAWFTFTGTVNGETVEGSGDFFFDISCCDREPVQRTWTATDCLGNETTFTQTIYFVGDTPENNNDLTAECEGDLNGDFNVTVDDLLILLSGFGCSGENCPGDLDLSDDTSTNDLVIFLGLLGNDCE